MADVETVEPIVKSNDFVEMSLRITKASYNKSDKSPMKWAAIDSDIESDLYDERMSIELYRDFCDRIQNNTPLPEEFKSAVCEDAWCGGMPYLSIAHYKAGSAAKNVPGMVESVFIDGTRLKSKGTLNDSDMGRKVFDALREDLYMEKSGNQDHAPVRISIGFLDLEHKHLAQAGGQEFTFTRSHVGQICPLCAQGIGGKIYMKGQLIHLAMTRVPVNPRTQMVAERSDMEITTKRDDAKSIIGELADELEEKSIASDILVVRSDEDGSLPVEKESDIAHCYDQNTGEWHEDCIKGVMDKYMPDIRNEIGTPVVKSTALPKGMLDVMVAHLYKSNGYEAPVVEDAMETENVEKMQVGGKNVPHVAFEYEGVSGGVDANKIAAPIPVKAEAEDKEEEKEDVKEMSEVEKSFALLQQAITSKNVEEVNKAFASLGTSVEKAFVPEPKAFDPNDLASIIKSAVEDAVAPLRMEVATLKAQGQVAPASTGVVQSKALSLNPGGVKVEDLVRRAVQPEVPQQPARKLSQIEMIARKSTGASV